jgi:hypothetical protein
VKILKMGAAAVIIFLIVAQAFRIDKSNPPVERDVNAPPQVKEVMRRSCYGCHSNEVVWPWYADVAPASWLVAYDVHEGRAELNFSLWGRLHPKRAFLPGRAAVDRALDRSVAQGEFCTSWLRLDCRRDTRIRSGTTNIDAVETVAAAVARPFLPRDKDALKLFIGA